MKSNKFALSFVLVCASLGLSAEAGPVGYFPTSGAQQRSLRDAVEAHRAATRAEAKQGEAMAGRRLTPAELAELRQQVRQQSVPRSLPTESVPAERMVPAPDFKGVALGKSRP
ncbi:MAG: hypothetical protein J7605_02805 [Variovorax sp.]|nr:hypothetical protein [Variovorax sp.]